MKQIPKKWRVLISIVMGIVGLYCLALAVPYFVFVKPVLDQHRSNISQAYDQYKRDLVIVGKWPRELCSNCGTINIGPRLNRIKGLVYSPDGSPAEPLDWGALGLSKSDANAIESAKEKWPGLKKTMKIKTQWPSVLSDLSADSYWELPVSKETELLPRDFRASALITVAKGRLLSASTDEELQRAMSDIRALAQLVSSTQSRIGTDTAIRILSLEREVRKSFGKSLPPSTAGFSLSAEDEARLKRVAEFPYRALHPSTEASIRRKVLSSENNFAYCGAIIDGAAMIAAIGYIAAESHREFYREIEDIVKQSKACRFNRIKKIWKSQGTMGDQSITIVMRSFWSPPFLVSSLANIMMAGAACEDTCATRLKAIPAH